MASRRKISLGLSKDKFSDIIRELEYHWRWKNWQTLNQLSNALNWTLNTTKKTQLKNQLCVLQSKLLKQTHLKNFAALLAQLSIKQKLKVWSTKTKLAVIKHVLQQNLANQALHTKWAPRSFFCCFQIRRRDENYDYRLFRLWQVNIGWKLKIGRASCRERV